MTGADGPDTGTASADAPVAPSSTARPGTRHRIASYGEGRTCAARGCDTTLSRYNSSDRCGVHELGRDHR